MKKIYTLSLYYRLLIVFGITFLILGIIFNQVFKSFLPEPAMKSTDKFLKISGAKIAQDLYQNLSETSVKEASQNYQIEIYYRGLNDKWKDEIAEKLQDSQFELSSYRNFSKFQFSDKLFIMRPSLGSDQNFFSDSATSKFFLVILGLVILLANSFLIRKILSPINSLKILAEGYGQENFSSRLNLSRTDEIGVLANTFDSMADRIQKQVSSLKHLAVGVSHEIRSPLARMRMAAELIPESDSKDLILRQMENINQVTEAILEREALQSGIVAIEKSAVDISAVLTELCDYYRESGYNIRLSQPTSTVIASGDRRRLEMLFKNILDNSFEHGPKDILVEVILIVKGTYVEIYVHNMTNHKVDSDDSSSIKYGIGLMLSDSIARAHDGTLEIKYASGRIEAKILIPRDHTTENL